MDLILFYFIYCYYISFPVLHELGVGVCHSTHHWKTWGSQLSLSAMGVPGIELR